MKKMSIKSWKQNIGIKMWKDPGDCPNNFAL